MRNSPSGTPFAGSRSTTGTGMLTTRSYWLGSRGAVDLLAASRQRLGQLGDKGFVPFVRH